MTAALLYHTTTHQVCRHRAHAFQHAHMFAVYYFFLFCAGWTKWCATCLRPNVTIRPTRARRAKFWQMYT